MAVLLHEADAVLAVEGEHRDGSRVADVLAHVRARVTQVDLVADDVPDPPLHDDLAVPHGLRVVLVVEALRRHGASASTGTLGRSTSTSRAARCSSMAAPMSPANSGCARVGRDLNSGWACVAT